MPTFPPAKSDSRIGKPVRFLFNTRWYVYALCVTLYVAACAVACVAVCVSVCVAVCVAVYGRLQHTDTDTHKLYCVLQCVAVCCSMLCTVEATTHKSKGNISAFHGVCCSVLRCVAVCCGCCSVWQCEVDTNTHKARSNISVECSAVCCSVLRSEGDTNTHKASSNISALSGNITTSHGGSIRQHRHLCRALTSSAHCGAYSTEHTRATHM